MPLLSRLNSRVSKKNGCATAIEYFKLLTATNNFNSNNILGEGGFGCVYKAMFDDDSFAAVKKLDEGSRQVEHEFQVGNKNVTGIILEAGYFFKLKKILVKAFSGGVP